VIFFPDVLPVYFARHAHLPEAEGVIATVSTSVISGSINFALIVTLLWNRPVIPTGCHIRSMLGISATLSRS
jgi:hypothetical protein